MVYKNLSWTMTEERARAAEKGLEQFTFKQIRKIIYTVHIYRTEREVNDVPRDESYG